MAELIAAFDQAMFDIYRRAKIEAGYNATIFLGMLTEQGGLATAKVLINAPKESAGYTALYLKACLHLTVEAVVLENSRWHSLFTEIELDRARTRLVKFGYAPMTAAPG